MGAFGNLGDWFSGDTQKIFFSVSKQRMEEGDYDLKQIAFEAGSRSEADEGLFNGHPFVLLEPSLTVEQTRKAKRTNQQKTTLRLKDDHTEYDIDNDPDYSLRLLAEAIEDCGGDWSIYHSKPPKEVAANFQRWKSLTRDERVVCLKWLVDRDADDLAKRVKGKSKPTEAERGK